MGPPQKRFSAFEGRGGATERMELSAKPEAEGAEFAPTTDKPWREYI